MQVQGLSNQFRGQIERVQIRQTMSFSVFGQIGLATLVLALGACSADMSGAKAAESVTQVAAADVQSAPLSGTSSKFGPTAVGQKAAQLRADFEKLKTNTATRSQQLDVIRNQTVSNM